MGPGPTCRHPSHLTLHPPPGWCQSVSVSLSTSPRAGMGGVHRWGWDPSGAHVPWEWTSRVTRWLRAPIRHTRCTRTGSGWSWERLGTVSGQYRDQARSTPSSVPEQYRDRARTVPGQYLNHTWTVPGPCQDCTKTVPELYLDRTGTGTVPGRVRRSRPASPRYYPAPIPGIPVPVPGAGRGGRCPRPGALLPLPAGTAGAGRDGSGRRRW